MNPHGVGSTSLTPLSVSMSSSSGDHLNSGKSDMSSATIITPRPINCATGEGSVEYSKVTSLHVGGTSTVQVGGGGGGHNEVGDTKEDEETRAMWTRETFDPVEPKGAVGNQPHLMSREPSSSSLLAVLSRARDLGLSIGMDATDSAQVETQIVDRHSGKNIHDAELLQMFGKLAKESKAAAHQRKHPEQALQAPLSGGVGARRERKERLADPCAEAQIEEFSDNPVLSPSLRKF